MKASICVIHRLNTLPVPQWHFKSPSLQFTKMFLLSVVSDLFSTVVFPSIPPSAITKAPLYRRRFLNQVQLKSSFSYFHHSTPKKFNDHKGYKDLQEEFFKEESGKDRSPQIHFVVQQFMETLTWLRLRNYSYTVPSAQLNSVHAFKVNSHSSFW